MPDTAPRAGSVEAAFRAVLAAVARGDFVAVERLCRRTLAVAPDHAGCLHQFAHALWRRGEREEAVRHLRRAAELAPEDPSLKLTLGDAYHRLRRFAEAAACFGEAAAQSPNLAPAHAGLGRALAALRRLDEAESAWQRALEIAPEESDSHRGLGDTLQAGRRFKEAEAAYRRALALNPDHAEARLNLGAAQHAQNRLSEAEAAYRAVIAARPDLAAAHNLLGGALLMAGRIAEGAAEYEWRLRLKKPSAIASSGRPRWDGRKLPGETILLHAEQGLGDMIQFARYASKVRKACGRVVVVCPPVLVPLLQTVPGVDAVLPRGAPVPEFAAHASLMSLMHILGTTLETIPAEIPYVSARPEAARAMAGRMGAGDGLKVGLVWAGSPHPDRRRSLPLERLAPVLETPGARFFGLQTGARAGDLERLPPGRIADLSPHLADFADTAAAVAGLDLVISVDTSVAHLAGALGRPVWTLLPEPADWRWMRGRADSPWYPTMRLFRQAARQDWAPVVAAVREALQAFAAGWRGPERGRRERVPDDAGA